jgi:hypothetical protein
MTRKHAIGWLMVSLTLALPWALVLVFVLTAMWLAMVGV